MVRDSFKRERGVSRGLESLLRTLFQAVAHHAVKGRGHPISGGKIGRLVCQDRVEGFDRRVTFERPLAGEHLVEHGAKAEDIRPVIDALPPHLLGRHVAHRAEHEAGIGLGALGQSVAALGWLAFSELRDAEVENLHAAVSRDEQVLRLEIAVDDAALVRGGKTPRDLNGVVGSASSWQWRASQLLAQGRSFEQLADDVRRAVVVAYVMNHEDVRVIQSAGSASLLLRNAEADRDRQRLSAAGS